MTEVKRRGSVSAAAAACRVSQPSATKHLKTIEAALGERLLERNGRTSRLTQAGEVAAAHALRVLDTLEAMREELRALRDAEGGVLTLAASTTPGTYVLPSILRCFADAHPGVEVDVVIGASAWVVERVARREVSLGLAGEVDLPEEVAAEPFLEDRVVGIAAPGHVALRDDRLPPEALADHLLLVRERGSSTRAVAERYLGRLGLRSGKRWELDSNEAIKRSVRAGLGIAFVSRLVVEEELDRRELTGFEIEGAEPLLRSIQLLRPAGRELTPAERAFVGTIARCCQASLPGCEVAGKAPAAGAAGGAPARTSR
ncbi:MAG: LysR substrate-binding domain-containing protein [Actinomycetota bacterium]|nr:LysR substrate-binding domain-containing protein [Actinomycetota bacterium]